MLAHSPLSALVLVVVALMLPATAAQGAVTLGSSLDGPVDIGFEVNPTPTFMQTALPNRQLVSPMDGVITRWRIKYEHGPSTLESYQLRVLRPVDGLWRGAGTSPHVPFPVHPSSTAQVRESEVRLPVRSGDAIGLDAAEGATLGLDGTLFAFSERTNPAFSTSYFSPKLGDGQARATTGSVTTYELLLNADVEPDVDGDGLGDETQDADSDGDGVDGAADNCRAVANPDQRDSNGNGVGDACEEDADGDGVPNGRDNCVTVASANQADLDGDAQGDACDADDDGDGVSDGDEAAIGANARAADSDGDGLGDLADRCPAESAQGGDGCPGAAAGGPTVTRVPDRMKLAAFLRGVRLAFSSATRMAAEAELRIPVRSAQASAARLNLTLARGSLGFGTGSRELTLRPNRRLVRSKRPFRAQLLVVATARDGSRISLSRTIRVRP